MAESNTRYRLLIPTDAVPIELIYRPRNPRTTVLFQRVEAHYEDVKSLREDRFEKTPRFFHDRVTTGPRYRSSQSKTSLITTSVGGTCPLSKSTWRLCSGGVPKNRNIGF